MHSGKKKWVLKLHKWKTLCNVTCDKLGFFSVKCVVFLGEWVRTAVGLVQKWRGSQGRDGGVEYRDHVPSTLPGPPAGLCVWRSSVTLHTMSLDQSLGVSLCIHHPWTWHQSLLSERLSYNRSTTTTTSLSHKPSPRSPSPPKRSLRAYPRTRVILMGVTSARGYRLQGTQMPPKRVLLNKKISERLAYNTPWNQLQSPSL